MRKRTDREKGEVVHSLEGREEADGKGGKRGKGSERDERGGGGGGATVYASRVG